MSDDDKPLIKRALLIMLRPLVRLLIKHDIAHSEFAEIAKEAYVRTAFEDMNTPGKKPTISQAAVITGLSRKEVARILGTSQSQPLPKLTPNRAARVTTGWLSDAEFCTKAGKPKVLNKAEFDVLTQRYSGDITPGAIFDELKRLSLLTVDEKGRYHLNPQGFIVSDGQQAKGFSLLTKSLTHLLETGEYNLAAKQRDDSSLLKSRPHFQRQLTEQKVPITVAEQFHEHASQQSMQLLIELNQWLAERLSEYSQSLPPAENNPQEATKDFIGLGIYYFESRNQERLHETTTQPKDRS